MESCVVRTRTDADQLDVVGGEVRQSRSFDTENLISWYLYNVTAMDNGTPWMCQ